MSNMNAPFFTSLSQQQIVDKQKAELYMQMYPYAAEDFLSSYDAMTYGANMQLHINNMQAQLRRLFDILSTHTHTLPPHMHMEQGDGKPTSTEMGPLITLPPMQKAIIKWLLTTPPIPANTTGSVWNIGGNFAITGVPSDGMLKTSLRRAQPLLLTLEVVLPPILTANIGL